MSKISNMVATVDDDDVTVVGLVDDVEVTIHVWKSHLDTLGTKAAKRAFIAQQLKAATPKTKAILDLSGADITV